jgi:hypothetical protein
MIYCGRGVSPEGKAVYELADGGPVELEYGFARIVFEPILGVIALEAAGIVVDPRTQTLKHLHARPLKLRRVLGRSPVCFKFATDETSEGPYAVSVATHE